MKLFRVLLCVVLGLVVRESNAQGCLIYNYDPYNKVFNVPVSGSPRTFLAGNGRNFVLWEGVCGPHTYVSLQSSPNGTCTVNGINRTGTYYPAVSTPFTAPCSLPLDDYIWAMGLIVGGISYYLIKRNKAFHITTYTNNTFSEFAG